jgi:hypothetical protein
MELIPKWTYRWYIGSSAVIIILLCQLLVSGFDEGIMDFITFSLKSEMSAEEIQDIIRRVEGLINTNTNYKVYRIVAIAFLISEMFYCYQLKNESKRVTENPSLSDS